MLMTEAKIKHCPCCGRNTKHERYAHKMSTGECLGHIAMILLTVGLWILIWFPYTAFNGFRNLCSSYHCIVCSAGN